jgi:hypothetical protein
MPSSRTRLVEANWKAIAATKSAPYGRSIGPAPQRRRNRMTTRPRVRSRSRSSAAMNRAGAGSSRPWSRPPEPRPERAKPRISPQNLPAHREGHRERRNERVRERGHFAAEFCCCGDLKIYRKQSNTAHGRRPALTRSNRRNPGQTSKAAWHGSVSERRTYSLGGNGGAVYLSSSSPCPVTTSKASPVSFKIVKPEPARSIL